MENKVIKLRDFYLLDNKLLYLSREFIGFDPLISKGLSYNLAKGKCSTKIKCDEFKMGGSSFNSILTSFCDYGPLRGYERVEILKNGKTIINYEDGGMGYGSNYRKGSCFSVENEDAYLIKDGHSMRDSSTDKIYSGFSADDEYFLWFKDIVIPQNRAGKKSILKSGMKYSHSEIESLRDIIWEANVNYNGHKIYIKETGVTNCLRTYGVTGDIASEEFRYFDNEKVTALDKIEFIWNYHKNMNQNYLSLQEKLEWLYQELPLVPHTNMGRLSSTVKRMKAEKEMEIPINLRTGFPISTATGKHANEMEGSEWEVFYNALSGQLKSDYPDLYQEIFSEQ